MESVRLWVHQLSTICVEAFETQEKVREVVAKPTALGALALADRGTTRHRGRMEPKSNPFSQGMSVNAKG